MSEHMRKPVLDLLRGHQTNETPIWLMRQAGRYLPEYKATRAQAGDFLSLCYSPELAAEVTLQPIRRFGFDASILFADILLIPQALGMNLWFEEGEGPRLSKPDEWKDFTGLKPADEIHEVLSPVYETVRILAGELPKETTLIGFAGAPWTVATYMIAGKGSPDQADAKRLMFTNPEQFDYLMDRICDATILYLEKQIEAGAEVIQLFDSWAGSLSGLYFEKYSFKPAIKIREALRQKYPDVPVIAFPRGAGPNYTLFADSGAFEGLGLDTSVPVGWAVEHLQPKTCVQGNLDPILLEAGGQALKTEVSRIKEGFAGGRHIFNLGHGITQWTNPNHVEHMLKVIRG